jgi:hypothetical protein
MPHHNPKPAVLSLAAGLDAGLLLVFVVIGRASHGGDGLWGVLGTWWPFLAGLAVAWAMVRAWRTPLQIVWTGLAIWAITVTVALLLRVASGQGVQVGFVVVTVAVIGLFLVGWRAIAQLLRHLRRPGRAAR